jgi:hypothetical protein
MQTRQVKSVRDGIGNAEIAALIERQNGLLYAYVRGNTESVHLSPSLSQLCAHVCAGEVA